jgi:hypothetical protein
MFNAQAANVHVLSSPNVRRGLMCIKEKNTSAFTGSHSQKPPKITVLDFVGNVLSSLTV